MLDDPRFRTNIDRSANLSPLGEIMREAMLTDTRANWENACRKQMSPLPPSEALKRPIRQTMWSSETW